VLATLLNGLTWSVIVPLFQVPDEPAHIAYAQYLAESHKPPSGRNGLDAFSGEERLLVDVLGWKRVSRRPDNRMAGSAASHQLLERTLAIETNQLGEGGYTSITNNPPLYYGLGAIAYRLSPSSTLPNRIHAMRLVSVLLAAVTALLVFGFLRELLPGTPWAWTIGTLAVAFQPMFGFVSGGVNSDALLFAAASGVFYMLARCFRLGLTTRRGLWLGALTAAGLLAKINMLGLLPGIVLGVLLLVLRAAPERRRDAARGALGALAVVAVAALVYIGLNETVWDRGLFFGASGASLRSDTGITGPADVTQVPSRSIGDALSYAWQFYLPRLPFMDPQFAHYPLYEVWFKGFIGNFGWTDYGFPGWVYTLACWIVLAVCALAGRELYLRRAVVRARLRELITYAVIVLGLLILTNGNGYSARIGGAGGFEQARYLLPLLALYGAIVALAARGAGRRWGPPVGVLLVSVAIAHTAVAMLLSLTRYSG
jgi:hypothetical protein